MYYKIYLNFQTKSHNGHTCPISHVNILSCDFTKIIYYKI